MSMGIRIALPKGRLLIDTARLLEESGWRISGYTEKTRYYRLKSERFPDVSAKVFNEKDVTIQVAIGNYDLGICGLDWIEELLVKYPSSALVKVKNLGYGETALYIAGSRRSYKSAVRAGVVRIASEYPNLAEYLAVRFRFKRFNIFPVWGAVEVYPPENAELVLTSNGAEELSRYELEQVSKVLDSTAFLIANKTSWETKDLSELLGSLTDKRPITGKPSSVFDIVPRLDEQLLSKLEKRAKVRVRAEDIIWLALPDGHQQSPTVELLNKAGIKVQDYPSASGNRRPATSLEGVRVKVIRPQDMPLQVANGNFDLAITGRDWLKEHLYRFPSSPVKELVDLKFGKVRVVAVVSETSGIADICGLRQFSMAYPVPCRVASEYVSIADKYARDNHLGMCRIVPTWGASEAFLPEDADVLIENTQTGQTLARHNLKIIDTLFESTACLVGNTNSLLDKRKAKRIEPIIKMLQSAVEGV